MVPLITLVVFLIYAVPGWWMGFVCHRNWLIRRELERTRQQLKPGFELAPAWYTARRRAAIILITVGPLSILIPIAAAVAAYLAEFRVFHIFMVMLVASSPMLFGWWGVIPIPGIEIDT